MSPFDNKEYALKKITITSEEELRRRNHECTILSYFTETKAICKYILRYCDDGFVEANNEDGTNDTHMLGIFYIRTELCSTFTVRDVIDAKVEPVVLDKIHLIAGIVTGLKFIHMNGIIHCDLKPENILLKRFSNIWIPKISGFSASFSITMSEESDEVSSILCHMRYDEDNIYKPPELMKFGDSYNAVPTALTKKVDIYSLGIIIFELMYPMSDTDRVGNINGLREQNPKFPTDLKACFTEEIVTLLKAMLHWDPLKRPTPLKIFLSFKAYIPIFEDSLFQQKTEGIFRSNFNDELIASPFEIESKEEKVYHLRRLFESGAIKHRMDLTKNLRLWLKKQGFTLYSTPCTSTIVAFERSKDEFTSLSLLDILVEKEKRDRCLYAISDMRLEFARSVAVNGVDGEMKRFDIQRLISPDRTFIYHSPEEQWQCAFDIVSSQRGCDEAHTVLIELLRVLDEIANQFMRGKLILKLNHTRSIGIVNETLTAMQATHALDTCSQRCEDTSDCRDSLKILNELISSLRTKQFSTEVCKSLNLNNAMNGCIYSGVIFELECTHKGETRIVAFGGEYRPAMQFQHQFNFRGSNQNLVAAGVTINIDIMANDENKHEKGLRRSYAGHESSSDTSSGVPHARPKPKKVDLTQFQANKDDLSNFNVIELIGSGCYGDVYKVINNLDGKMYALKKIALRYAENLKSVRQEVENMSKMYHTNVVRYIKAIIANVDVTETLRFKETKDSIYVYIQMELCEESLSDVIKSGRLCSNQKEQQLLFSGVSSGLRHIHENGVVHRDLKPSNILLNKNGEPKIADFGFSITINNGEESRNVTSEVTYARGAYNYLAPELRSIQENREKIRIEDYSQSSDVYSLGLIYFEIFYPMHDMQRWERQRIMEKLRASEPKFPEDIHKYMADIVGVLLRRMLDHNPERRPNISDIDDLIFGVCITLDSKMDPWNDSFDAEFYLNNVSEMYPLTRLVNYGSVLNECFLQLIELRNSSYELHNTKSTYESYYSDIQMTAVKSGELTKLIADKLSKGGYEHLSIPLVFTGHEYNNRGYNWYLLHSFFGLCDSVRKHGFVYVPTGDMKRSMVAYVAINNISDLKSFDILPGRKSVDCDFPFDFSYKEMFCTFDCVKSLTSSQCPMEAHMDVMSALNELITCNEKHGCFGSVRFELLVNHTSLKSLILQSYNISDHLLKRTFSDTAHFKDLMRESSNGEVDNSEEINAIFEEIDDWVETIRSHKFDFITKFCPYVTNCFYSGIVFDLCAYPLRDRSSEARKLIAFGGDYSHKIMKYKQKLLMQSSNIGDSLEKSYSVIHRLQNLVMQAPNDQVGNIMKIDTLCTELDNFIELVRSHLVDCTENTSSTHVGQRVNANVESMQAMSSSKIVAFGSILTTDWNTKDEPENLQTLNAQRREREKLIFDALLTKITEVSNNMAISNKSEIRNMNSKEADSPRICSII